MDSGFSFPHGAVWLTPVIGLLVFILACLLFKAGLRRYDSAGS